MVLETWYYIAVISATVMGGLASLMFMTYTVATMKAAQNIHNGLQFEMNKGFISRLDKIESWITGQAIIQTKTGV